MTNSTYTNFLLVLRKCNYLHSSQIYKDINDILTALSTYSNIVGHIRGPTRERPPYCTQIFHTPNTCSVAIFAKIEVSLKLCTKNRTRTNLVTDAFVYSGIYTRRGVFWPLGQHIVLTLLFMLISAGFPASS